MIGNGAEIRPLEMGRKSPGRGVEIPCPTCPTGACPFSFRTSKGFLFCFSLGQVKIIYDSVFPKLVIGNCYDLTVTCCVESSVDPDQLASEKAS